MILTQNPKWNPRLGNPYRTRWTEQDGQFYKVSAETLSSVWDVEQVDRDGRTIEYVGVALNLNRARQIITDHARV